MKKTLFTIFSICLLLVTITPAHAARRHTIRDNGSRSTNTITDYSSRLSQIRQTSTSSFTNSITSINNTGYNSSSRNTGGSTSINTGSTYESIIISNQGGSNYLEVDECCENNQCDHDHSCTPEPSWATEIVNSSQGTLKSGDPIVDPQRTDPSTILGNTNDWFSLGDGGVVTIAFDNHVLDQTGDDLWFHEVTNDRGLYPEEKALVEVSQNGSVWFSLGEVTNNDNGTGIGGVDLADAGLAYAQYVRITDTTDYSIHDEEADGYDLKAVYAGLVDCE